MVSQSNLKRSTNDSCSTEVLARFPSAPKPARTMGNRPLLRKQLLTLPPGSTPPGSYPPQINVKYGKTFWGRGVLAQARNDILRNSRSTCAVNSNDPTG